MKRLSASGLVAHLIWHGAVEAVGIADSTVLGEILKAPQLRFKRKKG